ncbi:uncharacterized protein BYT42DRAFT_617500 [Radiomyces spectabilis]|uniref:uncharacterized protein n=1 Tax=Radiomyces spectabilis TaxID=64574 RepID=UPI00221E5165|nr:uncharacterized protein BYT42DRAFT_617500 [Radiomyces spectabilis]KAI8369485.1 hypothetical protein BYT42DRAFT_617500 [Radiomyces spectabilis]
MAASNFIVLLACLILVLHTMTTLALPVFDADLAASPLVHEGRAQFRGGPEKFFVTITV